LAAPQSASASRTSTPWTSGARATTRSLTSTTSRNRRS